MKIVEVFWVAIGGAVGAVSRWGLSTSIRNWGKFTLGPYPVSILMVNAIGCYLASKLTQKGILSSDNVSLALGVGFLGGFTTLSALNLEIAEFVRAGQNGLAISYLFIHLGVCAVFSALAFAF